MLDVHPAHHAAATWREFFIHIATIILGLLIAIGLEQTVEALHHRHQRHELEAQLRDETRLNLDLVEGNLTRLQPERDWVNRCIVALNQAPVTHGLIRRSVLPPAGKLFERGISEPSQTVWAVAKANGTVGLLPEDEAQVYARLDHEADELERGESGLHRALTDSYSLHLQQQGRMDAQHEFFTLAERDAVLHRFSDASSEFDNVITLEVNEAGACRGALNGDRSVETMIQSMVDEGQRFRKQFPAPQN